jgi:hypothetical protein
LSDRRPIITDVSAHTEETIRSAVFRYEGLLVEVEPVAGRPGEWRARVVDGPGGARSGWIAGRRAWPTVEAAALTALGRPLPPDADPLLSLSD